MPAFEATAVLAAKTLTPLLGAIAKAGAGPIARALKNWSSAAALRKVAKTISKVENVKTLWSPDKEVSLYTFYYPSKVSAEPVFEDLGLAETPTEYKRIERIEDLPSGNLTIEGIVGQGKSIFLRFLASQSVRDLQRTKMPIFVELRTLTAKLSLRQAIYRYLTALDVSVDDTVFEYLADSGHLILLLDAFDELLEELVPDVLNELDYLITKHPDLRIIVTSRPGNEIQKASGFRTVELGPLRRSEFPAFLQKLGLQSVKRAELLGAIDRSPSRIDQIIRTPLMLTLVVIVYESEREIPPTLSDFFERLFQVVFTRHDRLKAGFNRKHHSGLSERRLQTLFEAFCFMTLQAGHGRTLSREQFNQVFDKAIAYTQGCLCEVEKFRLDITKVACLMLEEGIDLATFLHKSIVEYYAAAFISHSTDDVARLFYQHALENYKPWAPVISFLRDVDQYRFAKEYTMHEASSFLQSIEAICESKDQSKLVKFIHTLQPGIGVAIRKTHGESGTEFGSIRAYGPMTEPKSLSQARLPDYLFRAMDAVLPRTISDAELLSILKSVPHASSLTGAEDEVLVPYDVLIRHFGPLEFFRALEQLATETRNSITKARSVIEAQDRRKLIFADAKPSSTAA